MLKLSNVSLSNRIERISVDTDKHGFIHVLGANGSGKSTLLSVISGLLKPESGSIVINEKSIDEYSLQELSQFRTFLEQSQVTAFSLSVKEGLAFYSSEKLPLALEEALEVEQFKDSTLNQLSGGEQQRVHIARVLMQIWSTLENGQGLVLLDEPFQGLDLRHQHLLCHLLKKLSDDGNLVIISQHDLNLCQQYADSVWLMKSGQLHASGKPLEVLIPEQLEDVFECKIEAFTNDTGRRVFATALNELDR